MKLSMVKYKPDGIPVLSHERINALGEEIVRQLMPENFDTQIDATDLKKLLKGLEGWHFGGRFLSKDGRLLGLASFQGGTISITDGSRKKYELIDISPRTILVDRGLYDPYFEHIFRFTFAHECAHAILHERFCSIPENMQSYAEEGKKMLVDSENTLNTAGDEERLHSNRDWVEWQANALGSAMLMPRTLVERVGKIVEKEADSDLEYMNQLNTYVSDVFKVSGTAAFYRIKGLGMLPEGARRLNNGVIVL